MSIVSSLYAGASGLQSLGNAMQVIGNNIANVNTIGFKSSRAEFSDLLSQTLGGFSLGNQVGRGVSFDGVLGIFSQGSFENTSRSTDLAISGNGFFVVSDGQADYYTRAGQFTINADGFLTDQNDLVLQGYQYSSDGVNTGAIGDINLSNRTNPPQPTTEVSISANLDAEGVANTFNATDPQSTSNYTTSITVYDSLGTGHTMSVYFVKTSDLNWEWHGMFDGGELDTTAHAGATAGEPYEVLNGTLVFQDDGALLTMTQNAAATTVTFAGGAAAQDIALDFGTPTDAGGSGFDGVTQFAGPQVVNYQGQNGYGQGQLQAIDINTEGLITGVFSNGRTQFVGQVVLANFQNATGLERIGGNLFTESIFSGVPTIGAPETGGFGSLASASLELSNVDLTNEFVQMITNQRGFQANSRVITVGDELLEQIVNLT